MEWLKENYLVLLSVLIAAVAVGGILLAARLSAKKGGKLFGTKDLTYGAVCLATAFALSFFGYSLPQGGTITPASVLPIMLYCHYFGFRKGALVCVAFTLLQFMQKPYLYHPMQVILDYFLPYLALCLTGILSHRAGGLEGGKNMLSAHRGFFLGAVAYTVVRYLSHVLSGAIFFAEYAWDGWGAWPYSFAYNLFAVIDAAIAVAAGCALLHSKTFNTFMAASPNVQKHADPSAEDDQ